MASTLKKNSAVDCAEYNNYINDFATYIRQFQKVVKDIVENNLATTVMKQNIWTDAFASEYAIWFNDESGVSDGSDLLNASMSRLEGLFKSTCFVPIKDVVKLIGKDELSIYPMIKKAYGKSNIYQIINIKKYRKAQFPRLDTKLKNGWKVSTDSSKVNQMFNNIDKDADKLKDIATKVQSMIQKRIVDTGDRCIAITGFDASQLKKAITDINNYMDRFKKKTAYMREHVITNVNDAQTNINSGMSTTTSEN